MVPLPLPRLPPPHHQQTRTIGCLMVHLAQHPRVSNSETVRNGRERVLSFQELDNLILSRVRELEIESSIWSKPEGERSHTGDVSPPETQKSGWNYCVRFTKLAAKIVDRFSRLLPTHYSWQQWRRLSSCFNFFIFLFLPGSSSKSVQICNYAKKNRQRA